MSSRSRASSKSSHAYQQVITGAAPAARRGNRPPAARLLRRVASLLVIGVTALSIQAAIGEDAGAVAVRVQCGPCMVGVASACTATIVLDGGIGVPVGTGAFPIMVGSF